MYKLQLKTFTTLQVQHYTPRKLHPQSLLESFTGPTQRQKVIEIVILYHEIAGDLLIIRSYPQLKSGIDYKKWIKDIEIKKFE